MVTTHRNQQLIVQERIEALIAKFSHLMKNFLGKIECGAQLVRSLWSQSLGKNINQLKASRNIGDRNVTTSLEFSDKMT